MIGVAIAPNATGAVLATRAMRGGLDRLEADGDHHHRGDRHGRSEAGERLEQCAEAEGDDHRLDALVVRDRPKDLRSTAKWPVSTVML